MSAYKRSPIFYANGPLQLVFWVFTFERARKVYSVCARTARCGADACTEANRVWEWITAGDDQENFQRTSVLAEVEEVTCC